MVAATSGKSVIAWRERKKNCGIVAMTSTASAPARALNCRRRVTYTMPSAAIAITNVGSRIAHSGCAGLASGTKSTPATPMLQASAQKRKTGLDQNHLSWAHHKLIQSLRARISLATSP